jgi:uncharacterized damage-inducible protein DinB
MMRDEYLKFSDDVMEPVEGLFLAVPPDRVAWKPTNSSFSTGQLMAHIVLATRSYADGIATGEWGMSSLRQVFVANRRTPTMAVEESVKAWRDNRAYFNRKIQELSEEEFQHGEVFGIPFSGPVVRWRLALFAAEHLLSHKAELFMYIKLMGERVHTGHLYSLRKWRP